MFWIRTGSGGKRGNRMAQSAVRIDHLFPLPLSALGSPQDPPWQRPHLTSFQFQSHHQIICKSSKGQLPSRSPAKRTQRVMNPTIVLCCCIYPASRIPHRITSWVKKTSCRGVHYPRPTHSIILTSHLHLSAPSFLPNCTIPSMEHPPREQ